jgi:hypothetical protein
LANAALIGGVLAKAFLKDLKRYPPFPLKDPRLCEAMGGQHPCASAISGGDLDETNELADAGAEGEGGAR